MTQTELAPRPVAVPAGDGIPEISVVVPVFNEEATLEEVYRRAVEALEALGRPYELIVVDDGSSDGTWAILERLHAGRPARPRRPLQAELRPAPGDARGARRARAATSS